MLILLDCYLKLKKKKKKAVSMCQGTMGPLLKTAISEKKDEDARREGSVLLFHFLS